MKFPKIKEAPREAQKEKKFCFMKEPFGKEKWEQDFLKELKNPVNFRE